MLQETFLAPYRKSRDPFVSLLSRSTYLSKYCRDGEAWTDTVRRCVEANVRLDPNGTVHEAELLFHAIWHGYGLPPGRGLWTGGVPGIPIDARYNCHYGTLRDPEDWCWVANMLMCGGGVGVGLQRCDELPVPRRAHARLYVLCSRSHANEGEVMPDPFIADPSDCEHLLVEDSRLGWVEALRRVLRAAFLGESLIVNVSPIRKRGSPIKTFGGVASGPGPLATLLRQVWAIVRAAQGRKLTSVECADVTNHIGVCIKSGNVRRSALIQLGRPEDQAFRDLKKVPEGILNHRHSSNNSILFETEEQLDAFDWKGLVLDNAEYGEPGGLNLWRIRMTDPLVEGINPCGEIPLEDREACCLAEVYPALCPDEGMRELVLRLLTRYTLRQRLQPMTDPRADAVRTKNMRIGVGLGGLCDFEWSSAMLANYRGIVRRVADDYARELGVARPIAVTTVKPSGTISLLNGSSPGIHAPFAPYYIRRVRFSKDEAMAHALIEAGVPHEDCSYDVTKHTWVFEFPMAARGDATKTVQNETVADQLIRKVVVEESWADNAVSATISFGDDERDELADHLAQYGKRLKSFSCLPKKHAYVQPPYEAITREEFERRTGGIRGDHPLVSGGEMDLQECEGGACPVR